MHAILKKIKNKNKKNKKKKKRTSIGMLIFQIVIRYWDWKRDPIMHNLLLGDD
jgi:hypothetical protein